MVRSRARQTADIGTERELAPRVAWAVAVVAPAALAAAAESALALGANQKGGFVT